MKKRGVGLRIKQLIDRFLYSLANYILGIFNYGYFHAKYNWGGKVIRVPVAGEDMDISRNTIAVLARKDGKWGKGAALRLVYCGKEEKDNGAAEKFAFRHTFFGNIEFIKYWDFGKFTFVKKEE